MNLRIPSPAKSALPQQKEELEELPPLAKELLTRIWEYQLDHGEWISAQDLFRNESNPNAKKVFEELTPSKVMTASQQGRLRYGVTLLGILSAKNGKQDADLLVRYLKFILKRYKNEPGFTHVTDSELRAALKIGEKKAYQVGLLVYAGRFCHQDDSNLSPKMSRISLPADIDELQREDDLLNVVKDRAIKLAENLKPKIQPLSEKSGPGQIVKEETTPPLTKTKHSKVWNIGAIGNVFKEGRPFHRLWADHAGSSRKVALPLKEVRGLLLDYLSRPKKTGGPTPELAPKNDQQLWDLYVKRGFAEARQVLSQ